MPWKRPNRIAIGWFSLALAILVGISCFSYLHTRELIQNEGLVARSLEVREKLSELNAILVAGESGQRGYILTGDQFFLAPYRQASAKIPIILKNLRELTADNLRTLSLIANLEPLINQEVLLLEQGISLMAEGNREAAVRFIKSGTGRKLLTDIQSSIAFINKTEDQLLAQRQAAAKANNHKLLFTIIIGSIFSFGILSVIFYFLLGEIGLRRRTERDLRLSEERLRAFMENSPAISFMKDEFGRYVYFNGLIQQILVHKPGDLVGLTDYDLWPLEVAQSFQEGDLSVLSEQKPLEMSATLPDKDGNLHSFLVYKFPIPNFSGRRILGGVAVDITRQKQLEQQFNQAQKLEAIGRLAAGVAHDFNNLLTAIIGYAELLRLELSQGDALESPLQEIIKAGQRAAALTQQLLAFSRKQMLQPKPLNLNDVVGEMEEMLHRLISEDIQISVLLTPDLGAALADPVQIEQIILNLVINARDALPRGGQITLETANVLLDEGYSQSHPEVTPGPYVMLAVTDNGEGMDAQTKARIFDPFFTTKEVGQGTGLGLSSVYGIVKQSDGHIWVYSEPGLGTTFKVYLPRMEADSEPLHVEAAPGELPRGWETVLVVEDEEAVRTLIIQALKKSGYTVLAAPQGEEALAVCAGHPGPVHLLLADVILPKINGPELAAQLKTTYPELQVLFMSGYSDNTVFHHGVLDAEVNFLQKPFSVESLIRKVHEVLTPTLT
jgi:two-component system cell cycle sensor histidine kinase/response regulator CckA